MADRHDWTHPVCGLCYGDLEPTRVASRVATGAKGEHCCRCGALTHSGMRELAQVPETPLTTQELHQRVLNQLPGPERRILEVILAEYPTPLANAECAERAGYSPDGGAYNNPRGRLRSLGLIEYQSGKVVARSILFPDGQ